MIKDFDIQEACDVINAFAVANQVDHLRALELMVTYYNQLSPKEQQSLVDFMAYTKVDSKII